MVDDRATTQGLMDHPDPKIRWKNRRRMAWLAMVAGLLYPMLFLFVDSPNLASVAWPVMGFCGSIVSVYTGSSAWESIKLDGARR